MRVDARLMQMVDPPSPTTNLAKPSQVEVGAVGVNPSQTLSDLVDEDGVPLFSVTADFGRLAAAPKPIEPRSTGIDMTRVDAFGVPVPKPPPSAPLPHLKGLQNKQWRGRLDTGRPGPEVPTRSQS